MSRTLTVRRGNANNPYKPGWHEVTITKAVYGDYNDSKFLDIWFDGYSDKMNARIYEKMGKDGEEFAVGQVFRFANAGITDALESADGNTTIKMNDEPGELVGKTINIFLYKDGEYSRVLKQIAPTVFENIVESFKEDDVEYWKGRAEKYFTNYVQTKLEDVHPATTTGVEESIPF